MAPREDLISSAITFLQDPSVASSPVEKRIEFLKSKNLTQEEIDISLARASGEPVPPPPSNAYYPPPQQYRGPPSSRYGYPYNPYGEWQPPPPEPPKRDWRDWFIMATVVGGASYGIYALAHRYIKPLIAPPTPPQLEQDKAAIDEQFNKAFTLLDTLTSDTSALKAAEEARTQKLDKAITEVESIVAELKTANMKREADAERMASDIKGLKDSLPRSLENVRDASERQLKELSAELASLKLLMSNRMGTTGNFTSMTQNIPRTQPATLPGPNPMTNQSNPTGSLSTGAITPSSELAPGSGPNITGVNPAGKIPSFAAPSTSSYGAGSGNVSAASSSAQRAQSSYPFMNSNKASIPAWQMAASGKKDFTSNPSTPNTLVPGASAPITDGADAVAALNMS